MRVYLDCCSLQRPFDDRSQPRIAVEAEAVLVIPALCESRHVRLISSESLLFEIDRIPVQTRRENASILKLANKNVELTTEVEAPARKLMASGLKPLDVLHLASA